MNFDLPSLTPVHEAFSEIASRLAEIDEMEAMLDGFLEILFQASWLDVAPPGAVFLAGEGDGAPRQASLRYFDPRLQPSGGAAQAPPHYAVPIRTGGRAIGTVVVCTRAGRPPEEAERRVIEAATTILALALQGKISEQKRAKNEARLKSIIEHAFDGLINIDEKGTILAFNPASEAIFGYAASEVLGANVKHLMPGPYRHEHDRYLASYLKTGRKTFIGRGRETVGQRKNGERFPMHLSVAETWMPEGRTYTGFIRDLTETKKTEGELLSIGKILEESLNEIYIFDAETLLFVLVNGGARANLGYDLAELQAMTPLDIKPKYTRDSFERLILPLKLGERELVVFETVHRRKDGSLYDVEVRLQMSEYRGRNVFVAIILDITERKRAEKDRSALLAIIGETSDFVGIIDIRGRIVYHNAGAVRMLGLPEGHDLTGEKLIRMHPKWSADLIMREALPQVRAQGLWSGETSIMTAAGTEVPLSQVIGRLSGETGGEDQFFTIMRDISAVKKSETELKKSNRELERLTHEYETLLQNIPDLITRATPDTVLTFVNEPYADFFGVEIGDMLGRPFLDFIPEPERSEVEAVLARLTPEEPVGTVEHRICRPDGSEYWYSWSNFMIFEDGRPLELVSVGRNVTASHHARDQIQMQALELARKNSALEQFAGIVSHDLKAPLRHISMFSEMIAEELKEQNTANLVEYTENIIERSMLMDRMIRSLLEFSQLAHRRISGRMFALEDAVREAVANLHVVIEEAGGAEIEVSPLPRIWGDPALMARLFQNLIGNAVKYRRKDVKPRIRVTAERRSDGHEIAVEDNGIGIDPRYAERIFGIFQRLHRNEKRYDGTGIGLALCQKIAEGHQGSIQLDTSFEGGSRFVLFLPATGGKTFDNF